MKDGVECGYIFNITVIEGMEGGPRGDTQRNKENARDAKEKLERIR